MNTGTTTNCLAEKMNVVWTWEVVRKTPVDIDDLGYAFEEGAACDPLTPSLLLSPPSQSPC